ncbi:MAG: hypothetical protein JOZ52_00160 [Acidobacteria bacterium]|nr:hypothetical protein [Acidobacteriota bacterium]
MKRLFAVMLCTLALAAFAHAQTGKQAQDKSAQDKSAQEKTAPPRYDVYVGQYEMQPGVILTITNEKGMLMGQPTGDPKIEFKPEGDMADKFFSAQENVHLKFVRDEKGEAVVAVVVTFDGKDFPPAKKIK